MGDHEHEYSNSVNPDGVLPPAADSKEPKFSCSTNKFVIGVAAVSPVAWSSDGAWLVHATGDNSMHVCHKPGASATFKVHGVLVGHSEPVTCLVRQSPRASPSSTQPLVTTCRRFTPWSPPSSSPPALTACGFGTSPIAGALVAPRGIIFPVNYSLYRAAL
jgi:hypothetical protein